MSLTLEHDGAAIEVEDGSRLTVGRRGCDLAPNDHTLSRRHFAIEHRDGGWWVEDLQSTSGTWLDDHSVRRPTPLATGSRIRAGQTTFVVRID